MAYSKWQPSTLYLPGSIVIPTAVTGASATAIPNDDFDAGDSDWTKGAGWAINSNLPFGGTYSAEYSGPGPGELINDAKVSVAAGKAITATCFVHQGASDDGQANAAVLLRWYDAGDAFISDSVGNTISTGAVGIWQKSTVSAVAPVNAASVSIGCLAYNDWAVLNVDGFAWNYVTGVAAVGLAYKAVGQGSTGAIQVTGDFSAGGTMPHMGQATFRAYNAYGVGSSISDSSAGKASEWGVEVNDTITVTGTALNDGTYTVHHISQYAIGTNETLVDETPVNVTIPYSGYRLKGTANFEELGYVVGSKLVVTGSTSNDGTYTVAAVADGVIHFEEAVTPESGTFTISPEGVPTGTNEAGGMSGATEPAWPLTIGITVQDNEVLWEAIEADSVTWEATSILTSGQSEPTWPEVAGSFVSDNNIAWEAVPLRIEDENCPHSKVVAIAASKVFAGDTDIVRFCATLNARDWTSEDDAGYLPTGLQQKSQVGVDAMGVYRGNLAVWSGSTFQVWQVDPDPAAMALLDAMEGIGSIHQQAVQPVSDDLFFLAALGVRTVSVAAGSNNLASGDVGVPIDDLVQAEANQPDVEPVASYYPSAGQYWLAFRPLSIVAGLLAGQFLLTSTLYPIEAVDSFQTSSQPDRYWEMHVLQDEFGTSSTPKNGELWDALESVTIEPEAVETSSAPVSGDLYGDVIETNLLDSFQTSSVAKDGTLRAALISYWHPDEDEGFTTSSTPKDGTLT